MELFNFKDPNGQQLFRELTTNTNKLTQCFEGDISFEKQSQNWFKCLNSLFYKCFTKIRSKKRKIEVTQVDILLEKRKKLRLLIQVENEDNIQEKIRQTEEEINRITNWKDAEEIWSRFQQVASSDNSASTQAMWKLKKKIFPKIKSNPPMGVKDKQGQVKTKSHDIKNIYVSEYKHRLRARPLLPELQDTNKIQNQLFRMRM